MHKTDTHTFIDERKKLHRNTQHTTHEIDNQTKCSNKSW